LLDEGAHFDGQLVMQGAEGDQPLLLPRPAEGNAIPVGQAESVAAPAAALSEVAANEVATQDMSGESQAVSNN